MFQSSLVKTSIQPTVAKLTKYKPPGLLNLWALIISYFYIATIYSFVFMMQYFSIQSLKLCLFNLTSDAEKA